MILKVGGGSMVKTVDQVSLPEIQDREDGHN